MDNYLCKLLAIKMWNIYGYGMTTNSTLLGLIVAYAGSGRPRRTTVGRVEEAREASEQSDSSEMEEEDEEEGLLSPVGSITSIRRRAEEEGIAITGTN